MTSADIIIVIILIAIVSLIVFVKIKNRKETACSTCAYAAKYHKKRDKS